MRLRDFKARNFRVWIRHSAIGTEIIALLALPTKCCCLSILLYYNVIPILKLYFYRRYVITAANCFDNNLAEVLLGGDDLKIDPECPQQCAPQQKFTITTSDMIQHEGYTGRFPFSNDIALIRLPRLVNTFLQGDKYKVLPICMGWYPR